jgi:1,4-alpha-glucan branching enzyme
MISQANCTAATPMGATLLSDQGLPGGGATFRAWAPRARAVYVNGVFGGVSRVGQTPDLLLAKDANGYWSGFMPEAADGDTYIFYVVGAGSSGIKRDPYARELANDPAAPFPDLQRNHPLGQRVSLARFRLPHAELLRHGHLPTAHRDLRAIRAGRASTFLDVVEKVEYLVALGINVVQPLPVYEMEDSPSLGYPGLGYQGADLYSPAIEYAVYDPKELVRHLVTINRLLAAKGFAPMTLDDITPATLS